MNPLGKAIAATVLAGTQLVSAGYAQDAIDDVIPHLPPQLQVVENTPVPLRAPRKTVYLPGEELPAAAFTRTLPNGHIEVLYAPSSAKHIAYHASVCPNLIMEGRRGTGKSHTMRWDMHMRAMAYPGFKYLILRRTMPELRKSHLLFIATDMEKLGGIALGVRSGNTECRYPNGSIGLFGHCETEADVEKYLSAQFDAIVFDEITTFEWDMVTRISTSCRVLEGSGLIAIVRGGTNPLGVSAEDVYRYFVGKDVTPEEDSEYSPLDWGNIHIEKADNDHIDYKQYDKRFAGLPKAYQDAWRDGMWGVDGAYFSIEDRHLLKTMPVISGSDGRPPAPMLRWPWLHIYRVLDFGWHDPTGCVWIAGLPNGRAVPFMEQSWLRTTAQQVAHDILAASEGMKVITTFADPTMWDGEKEMGHCLAFEFEDLRMPLTKGKNDRTACGFAIQEYLNTVLADGAPKLQMLETQTPTLVRTLRSMRVDKKKPGRIADHKADHMPIALGYFCMSGVAPTRIPNQVTARPWMVPKAGNRRILGSAHVRTRHR